MQPLPFPRSSVESSAIPGVCVCFDMDGLLVNTEPVWWRTESELMTARGGTWSDEDGQHCVGGPLEKVADLVISRTGAGDTEQIIAELIGRMASALAAEPIHVMPGVANLMRDCAQAGIRMALVSASPRVLVDSVLGALGDLADLFDFTISCDDVPVSKPHPAPYLKAAGLFGIRADEMIVLEDSPTGVESAHAAGAQVLAVPHLVAIDARPGVRVVDSLIKVKAADLIALAVSGADRQQCDAATTDR